MSALGEGGHDRVGHTAAGAALVDHQARRRIGQAGDEVVERQRRQSIRSKLAPQIDREKAELEQFALSVPERENCVLRRLVDMLGVDML